MGPQTLQAQIQGVSVRQTSKGDVYDITANGQTYATFNRALAEQARQLQGQSVLMKVTEKQVAKDGRVYVNRYYEGAEPAGQLGFPTSGGITQPQFGNQPAQDLTPLSFPQGPDPATKDIRIMRQTGTKVAAWLMPYLPETERTPQGLLAMSEYLVGYYQDGVPEPSYGEPGADFGAPLPDDDIPF